MLLIFHHLSIILIHVELIVLERTLVLVYMFVLVHAHSGHFTVGFGDFVNHLLPELLMNGFTFCQLI